MPWLCRAAIGDASSGEGVVNNVKFQVNGVFYNFLPLEGGKVGPFYNFIARVVCRQTMARLLQTMA